ncbi:unnamed protein product [Heterobilharzia americana]|nr:unnamed protein product [Heterobilharzia americana]
MLKKNGSFPSKTIFCFFKRRTSEKEIVVGISVFRHFDHRCFFFIKDWSFHNVCFVQLSKPFKRHSVTYMHMCIR